MHKQSYRHVSPYNMFVREMRPKILLQMKKDDYMFQKTLPQISTFMEISRKLSDAWIKAKKNKEQMEFYEFKRQRWNQTHDYQHITYDDIPTIKALQRRLRLKKIINVTTIMHQDLIDHILIPVNNTN